jgi:hypothetical protein
MLVGCNSFLPHGAAGMTLASRKQVNDFVLQGWGGDPPGFSYDSPLQLSA